MNIEIDGVVMVSPQITIDEFRALINIFYKIIYNEYPARWEINEIALRFSLNKQEINVITKLVEGAFGISSEELYAIRKRIADNPIY